MNGGMWKRKITEYILNNDFYCALPRLLPPLLFSASSTSNSYSAGAKLASVCSAVLSVTSSLSLPHRPLSLFLSFAFVHFGNRHNRTMYAKRTKGRAPHHDVVCATGICYTKPHIAHKHLHTQHMDSKCARRDHCTRRVCVRRTQQIF